MQRQYVNMLMLIWNFLPLLEFVYCLATVSGVATPVSGVSYEHERCPNVISHIPNSKYTYIYFE